MSNVEKAKSAAAGMQSDTNSQTAQDIAALAYELDEQDVAALAYELWQARGCPEGSADEDWFHAVDELRSRS